jgi:thioredoxin reductase/ferredoxin
VISLLRRYAQWLHLQWPAGRVEPLPEVGEHGETAIPGVYIVGDLKGIPLLKFAIDSGARAVRRVASNQRAASDGLDLIIIGAGVSGMSAAVEAQRQGLRYVVLESAEPFATLVNFPKEKPIYTYPQGMTPEGSLRVNATVKEALVEELRAQTKDVKTLMAIAERVVREGDRLRVECRAPQPSLQARAVVIALGRSGGSRKLNVPGESLNKVYNRLHDPKDFAGQRALVVGGGDAALETAIALVYAGADVTLSVRGEGFPRAKAENVEQIERLRRDPSAEARVENPVSERTSTAVSGFMRDSRRVGRLQVLLRSTVREIHATEVLLGAGTESIAVPNDVVFTMIGRDAPLDFFRQSGIPLRFEWTGGRAATCAAFLLFCVCLYSWKSGGWLSRVFYDRQWWPTNLGTASAPDLISIVTNSASSPAFWYTLLYSVLVVVFGIRRIRRRRAPYITAQTLTLMAFQVLPLFLLPEIILPWLGKNGWLSGSLADSLFPVVDYGHGREYWRAYGFILAWPLMVYNVFTHQPLTAWLVISFLQTFVLIPAMIYFFGKGAYCGWICSCGALAETFGDAHRTKMPHGPKWNRLNLAGQGILVIAFIMLIIRVIGWMQPGGWADQVFDRLEFHYKWGVDVGLAGVLGVGLYFWASGRVWCRFFCPLAALMHVYTRFSRFRIFAEKKKCISCNVCTSVCHQGIDVMNFANKGLPVIDPQCVRCGACVHHCPTDVLSFGREARDGSVQKDALSARPRST